MQSDPTLKYELGTPDDASANDVSTTQLLVSVRSAGEVAAAVEGGADIIDVKETTKGSLGAAAPSVWSEVENEVSRQNTVSSASLSSASLSSASLSSASLSSASLSSATLPTSTRMWSIAMGELLDPAPSPRKLGLHPHFAKVGLAGLAGNKTWGTVWARWRESLPNTTQPVGVIYADADNAQAPTAEQVLETAAQNNCTVMLVDTFCKTAGGLLQHVDLPQLAEWCNLARQASMRIALAGSLDQVSALRVMELQPDWIAVRGAVCQDGRNGVVCFEKVRQLRETLDRQLT
jgi:hypothetical protein